MDDGAGRVVVELSSSRGTSTNLPGIKPTNGITPPEKLAFYPLKKSAWKMEKVGGVIKNTPCCLVNLANLLVN